MSNKPQHRASLVEQLLTEELAATKRPETPRLHQLDQVSRPYVVESIYLAAIRDRIRELTQSDPSRSIQEYYQELLASPPLSLKTTPHFVSTWLQADEEPPKRPLHYLHESALLGNRVEPKLEQVIRSELESAETVDIIMAFIRLPGVKRIERQLEELSTRTESTAPAVRVLTSVYFGNSEARAIDLLHSLGAEVRIDYEQTRHRLHAKAWCFNRSAGYSTALVGSSNLSQSALSTGLEWNLRISERESPHLLESFRRLFEHYWFDDDFEPYTGDIERLSKILDSQRAARALPQPSNSEHGSIDEPGVTKAKFSPAAITPRQHQHDALLELQARRELHAATDALIVAATGTGKTAIAAFDFLAFENEHPQATLLFIAHRRDIVFQARAEFQRVRADPDFGALGPDWTIRPRPRHCFATVQSLHGQTLENIEPDAFDYIVIDEFHHSAAPTYQALLSHFTPKFLLGLTATPERGDGLNVSEFFSSDAALTLRLWDALDQGILAPFSYFGIDDETDLSQLHWTRSGYAHQELENVISGNDIRARRVIDAVEKYIDAPRTMRALGFCVSIAHAHFMCQKFNEAGISSAVLSAADSDEVRAATRARLAKGPLQAIFTVDLLNEGVDIPELNTLLLLRPTSSPVVFQQQLGRGLRRAPGKLECRVLDLVGNHRREFGYESLLGLLTSGGRLTPHEVEQGFPTLPDGSTITLERMVCERVFQRLRDNANSSTNVALGPSELEQSISSLDELERAYYRVRTSFAAKEGKLKALPKLQEVRLFKFAHVTDDKRLNVLQRWADGSYQPEDPLEQEEILLAAASVNESDPKVIVAVAEQMRKCGPLAEELAILVSVLRKYSTYTLRYLHPISDTTLALGAQYHRSEISPAFRILRNGRFHAIREGVFFDRESNTDLLFVTLDKSDDYYTEATTYEDFMLSDTKFHWQSQNSARPDQGAGKRYVDGASNVQLFVRREKKRNGVPQPFTYLGPVRLLNHYGEKPITIIWELLHRIPHHLVARFQLTA